ncbi:MAG: hypothetical protein Q8O67_24120 [Deltaproteobacteria bacterium]|nr:hypothetical protein [Deltaproteobacteria bacterium]
MLWQWIEAAPIAVFLGLLITVPTLVVYRKRYGVEWSAERTVDGRRVKLSTLATLVPRIAIDVEANVVAGQRRAGRAAHFGTLARFIHVEAGAPLVKGGPRTVRIVLVPRGVPGDDQLIEGAVAFVGALERGDAALDGEGAPGGAPIAVRATGDVSSRR